MRDIRLSTRPARGLGRRAKQSVLWPWTPTPLAANLSVEEGRGLWALPPYRAL